VHRIYVEEGLQVRRRKRKRLTRVEGQPMLVPQAPNERRSMDFQHDLLATGQRLRTLNIVDDFTPECPAIEVDTSLPGVRVVRVLERLAETRGWRRAPRRDAASRGPPPDTDDGHSTRTSCTPVVARRRAVTAVSALSAPPEVPIWIGAQGLTMQIISFIHEIAKRSAHENTRCP
jgi:hypothetical protein